MALEIEGKASQESAKYMSKARQILVLVYQRKGKDFD